MAADTRCKTLSTLAASPIPHTGSSDTSGPSRKLRAVELNEQINTLIAKHNGLIDRNKMRIIDFNVYCTGFVRKEREKSCAKLRRTMKRTSKEIDSLKRKIETQRRRLDRGDY